MRYNNITKGVFLSRPNRFIAHVQINGKEEICHVKNTGRLKELLIEGATVYLEESSNPARKTKYDLVAAESSGGIFNIDSQAPNIAAGEYLCRYFEGCTVKPEVRYGDSRFDFYVEGDGRKAFVEVKGVTLIKDGTALFPDAPTQRGVKHINELVSCMDEGYDAYILFVIQNSNVAWFSPNDATHREFGDALRNAAEKGVNIMAVNCSVTPEEMIICAPVPVKL